MTLVLDTPDTCAALLNAPKVCLSIYDAASSFDWQFKFLWLFRHADTVGGATKSGLSDANDTCSEEMAFLVSGSVHNIKLSPIPSTVDGPERHQKRGAELELKNLKG